MTREPRLDALRDEIDDVDDRIHDLLMRRAEIADLVGASKRRQALNGTPQLFRPAREARVLRRLLARHRGPLPRRVVQDVWRSIIAGNLLLQGRMSVAVMPGASRAFARDHFGPFIDLHEESSPSGALAAVDGGKASVAVLPFPDSADQSSQWWPALLRLPTLYIAGQIPVLRSASAPTAALVAGQVPEASDVDLTLLLVRSAAIPAGPDAPRIVATADGDDTPCQLAALAGYFAAPPYWAGQDARIAGVIAAGIE